MKQFSNIAIIDDGIYSGLYILPSLKNKLEIKNGRIQKVVNKENILVSHGTICAGIIEKYSKHIDVTDIKILDYEDHRGLCSDLVKAIQWCLDHKIQLINLSLGSIMKSDSIILRDVLQKARDENAIIIASQNNNLLFTYPASLPNIIGVRHNETLANNELIIRHDPFDGIDILASSRHELSLNNGNVHPVAMCNSFAGAYVTALLGEVKYLYGKSTGNTKEELLSLLEKHPNLNIKKINYTEIPRTNISRSLPIINIIGNDSIKIIHFAKELQKLFLQNEYEITIVSLFNRKVKNEIDVLRPEPNMSVENFIGSIYIKYKPDLIIVCGTFDIKSDLKIIWSQKEVSLLFDDNKINFTMAHYRNEDIFTYVLEIFR